MKIINAWICQIKDNSIIPVFGDLEFENGIIKSISKKDFDSITLTSEKNKNLINAGGRVLTVPNVNYHDHIYSRLAKGLNIKGDMSTFPNILNNLWWKLDAILDYKMIKASAEMAAMESIKNGVTCIIDHHSSPNSSAGSLKLIRDTLDDFQLRSILCFETTDRNGSALRGKGIQENIDYIQNHTNDNHKALFGLHASFTLDDDTLKEVSEFVNRIDTGVHVHLCEDISDTEVSIQKYSDTPLKRFISHNLLNDKSILAHAIHLNDEEFQLINNSEASVVFNIDSNMNNNVGLQKYSAFPTDVPMLIGTDGMHSNYARSFKELFLQLRHSGYSFEEAFNLLIKSFFDQRNFIKKFFPDFTDLNEYERADFIIWDYVPPTPFSENNFWGHYVYGILERPIRYVFQDGKILLDDFKLVKVDEFEYNLNISTPGIRLNKKFNEG